MPSAVARSSDFTIMPTSDEGEVYAPCFPAKGAAQTRPRGRTRRSEKRVSLVTRQATVRCSFVAAVALVAAAVGDPCVEFIAGTGAFGTGYADTDHLGAIPALLAALALVAGLLLLRRSDGWRRACGGAALRDLSAVVPLQLGAVYGVEWLEAALGGHPVQSGLEWLGAPLPFSLGIYLAVAVVALFIVRRAVLGMAAAIGLAVELVIRLRRANAGV